MRAQAVRAPPPAGRAACVRPALPRRARRLVRPLLIDNYDSYTYNLYQIVAEAYGVAPLVLRNDEASLADIQALLRAGEVQHILLSPGPGSPHVPADIGVCLDVLRHCPDTPILGVCLGQQALAAAAGARVVRAPAPMHGRLSTLAHSGHELFAGCPSGPGSGFDVVRYHSLVVDASSLPDELEPLAWTCGQHSAVAVQRERQLLAAQPPPPGTPRGSRECSGDDAALIMALRHRERPHLGVQFHPESIATAYGTQLLLNFRDLACRHTGHGSALQQQLASAAGLPGRALTPRPWPAAARGAASNGSALQGHSVAALQLPPPPPHALDLAALGPAGLAAGAPLQLHWQRLPGALDAVGGSAALFDALVGPGPDSFWLDSSSAPERARFSYMSCAALGGALWSRVSYKLPPPGAPAGAPGVLTVAGGGALPVQARASIWDFLRAQLDALQLAPDCASAAARCLPFNLWCGYVGYLGYELKAQCGGANAHAAHGPDAAWLFADRLLAVDHDARDVYLLALTARDEPAAARWLAETAQRVAQLAAAPPGVRAAAARPTAPPPARVLSPPVLRHDRAAYTANVAACQAHLVAGDSYELCLTTCYTLDAPPAPWDLYSCLRAANPAPYSAWLSVAGSGPGSGGAVAVACSSPERFLAGGRGGLLEARPIKGTARRVHGDAAADVAAAAALLGSDKERAENLMIVDLLRNDLGRVCEPGSVHVPGLIELESFSAVHQLVSTVRGLRAAGVRCVDAARAAFPGGSMTGAPKVRSMALLDELEGGARGVYSGALGYFSVNDTFDLAIVIRTAVYVEAAPDTDAPDAAGSAPDAAPGTGVGPSPCSSAGWRMSVGAGGAVTVQSDAGAEFEEMCLKAERLLAAAAAAAAAPPAAPAPVARA